MKRSHKQYDENNNVYFIGKGPIRDTLSGLNYEMAKYMYDTNAEALKQNKITASKPGYRGSITPQELMRAEYDLQEQAKAMNRAKKQMIAARAGVGIGVPVVGALAYRHYKKKQQKNASDMLNEIHMEKTAGLKNIGKRYIEMLTGSAKRAAKTNLDTAMREFDNTKIKRDNLAIWRRQVNAQRDELNKQFNHYNDLRENIFKKQDAASKSINHYQDLVNNMYSEKNKLEKNIDDQYAMKTKAQKDLAKNKELPQLIKDNILAIHDKDIAKAKKDLEIFNSKTKNINSERQRVLDDLKSSRTQTINNINANINNIKAQQKDKANLVNNNINPRIQALAKKEEEFRESIPDLRKQYGKERANQILTVTGTVGVGGLGIHKAKKAIQNRVGDNKRR